MKIVCVGRNYRAHAAELGNPVPQEPVLFMKPESAMVSFGPELRIPKNRGAVHHEIELAVRVGANARVESAAIALDLTLRDVQNRLKSEGLPWERAKAFAASCPVSIWTPIEASRLGDLDVRLWVNGEARQEGNTRQMIWPVDALVAIIDEVFGLEAGDVVLTGTPSGVGPLVSGDEVRAEIDGLGSATARVV